MVATMKNKDAMVSFGNPMKSILSITPSLMLALAIVGVHLSGNDKAPVLVLIALLLGSGISLIMFTMAFVRSRFRDLWLPCLTTLLPWVYVLGVIVLARAGLVDPIYLLGFR